MSFKTDAEIAQSSTMRPIGEIAAKAGFELLTTSSPMAITKPKSILPKHSSCRKTRPSDFGYCH